MEKPLPVTSCTVCGKAGYNISLTNVQCEQSFNGKRCRGVNQSAIAIYDWARCPTCNGTGWNLTPWTGPASDKCVRCDGAGWLFVRDNPMTKKKITKRRRQTRSGSRLSR
jgi:DnaJ-class molecular chaperone